MLACALYCVLLSCFDVMIWAQTSAGSANDHERRLIYDLFKNYNRMIRPAANINDTIAVSFQQAMIQVGRWKITLWYRTTKNSD